MNNSNTIAAIGILCASPLAWAEVALGGTIPVGVETGGALPFSLGGIAAIAALSLIIGTQLIKRRKK